MSLIVLGKFGSPYGIKGWIKVISYSHPIDNLLNYQPWIVIKQKKQIAIEEIAGKRQGNHLIVGFDLCHDREAAKMFTNLDIYVERDKLPALSSDEYYWIDLIGLQVITRNNEYLGIVDRLFSTGANDVLVAKDAKLERYIPYIQDVVLEVDLKNKKLLVDWDPTF